MGVRSCVLTLHSTILCRRSILTPILLRFQEVDLKGQALAEQIYTYVLTGAGVRILKAWRTKLPFSRSQCALY